MADQECSFGINVITCNTNCAYAEEQDNAHRTTHVVKNIYVRYVLRKTLSALVYLIFYFQLPLMLSSSIVSGPRQPGNISALCSLLPGRIVIYIVIFPSKSAGCEKVNHSHLTSVMIELDNNFSFIFTIRLEFSFQLFFIYFLISVV